MERVNERAPHWKLLSAVGKTTREFMSRWLQRCDCEGWSRLFLFCFVFHKTNPNGWVQMSILPTLVASLGAETLLPLAWRIVLSAPWGKAGLVTL